MRWAPSHKCNSGGEGIVREGEDSSPFCFLGSRVATLMVVSRHGCKGPGLGQRYKIPGALSFLPPLSNTPMALEMPSYMRGHTADPDSYERDRAGSRHTQLSLRELGLRMEKPRRESYDLPGGSPPGLPGEGSHWICMLKAEQELAKHTWESYTLGEVWTTEERNNPSTSPLPPIRGCPGEAGRATVGMSEAKCSATIA